MKKTSHKESKKELLFITIIGFDKKGIVARVSDVLYHLNINIEDIQQKVVEGYFVMTMLVDMRESTASLEVVREKLEVLSKELSLKIQLHHENLFKAMHRV